MSFPAPQIEERFDKHGLTAFGGANLLVDLFDHLGLPQCLERHLTPKSLWATYSRTTEVEYLILKAALGMGRIVETAELKHDPLLAAKLRLKKLPHPATGYRALDRFGSRREVAGLEGVHREMLHPLLRNCGGAIVDIDNTVETVHGRQQGTAVGYNPRYHGRRSYQPFVAFEGQSRALLHAALRSGKTPNAREVIRFQAKKQLPEGFPVRFVRGDAHFGTEALLEELEAEERRTGHKVAYALKLRLNPHLQSQVFKPLAWRRLASSDEPIIEAASVTYQAPRWKRSRRVVFIRAQRAPGPSFEPAQRLLFEASAWEYQAIFTSEDWDEEDVWHFYNQRCTAENGIKELKEGLGIDSIGKATFWPNAADLLIKGIAYNLLLRLKVLAPAPYRHYTATRLQRTLLRVPALLVRHARRLTLRLPALWVHRPAWEAVRLALST
ncbi:transposase [Limnochorda pilosa]|uniref:Transposase n=2 Tax=Limnochorda pilosa TaxID=1555112 RepID=A0A0K2SHN2_LIMPI|nr:transposase [Limnochorda pilosa]